MGPHITGKSTVVISIFGLLFGNKKVKQAREGEVRPS